MLSIPSNQPSYYHIDIRYINYCIIMSQFGSCHFYTILTVGKICQLSINGARPIRERGEAGGSVGAAEAEEAGD